MKKMQIFKFKTFYVTYIAHFKNSAIYWNISKRRARASAWGSTTPLPVIQPPSSSVQTLLCSGLKGNVSREITGHKEIYHLISQGDERSALLPRIFVFCMAWTVMGKRDAYHQAGDLFVSSFSRIKKKKTGIKDF